jgi:hypothetical protein
MTRRMTRAGGGGAAAMRILIAMAETPHKMIGSHSGARPGDKTRAIAARDVVDRVAPRAGSPSASAAHAPRVGSGRMGSDARDLRRASGSPRHVAQLTPVRRTPCPSGSSLSFSPWPLPGAQGHSRYSSNVACVVVPLVSSQTHVPRAVNPPMSSPSARPPRADAPTSRRAMGVPRRRPPTPRNGVTSHEKLERNDWSLTSHGMESAALVEAVTPSRQVWLHARRRMRDPKPKCKRAPVRAAG